MYLGFFHIIGLFKLINILSKFGVSVIVPVLIEWVLLNTDVKEGSENLLSPCHQWLHGNAFGQDKWHCCVLKING